MKKTYTSPELEIIRYTLLDVLGTSLDNIGDNSQIVNGDPSGDESEIDIDLSP